MTTLEGGNPYALGERIERVVAHHARQRPRAAAVQQGDHVVSYDELVRQASVVAAGLRALGVGPGGYVAVRMPRSPELVTALLGVLGAGAAYVAVDPEWPRARVLDSARCTGTTLFITDDPEWLAGEGIRSVTLAALLVGGHPAPEHRHDGSEVASVFYTSGSTGRPKGVLSPHRGTIRTLVNCATIPLDARTVFLQAAPLPWDAMSLELWAPLLNGGRCVLLDAAARTLDAEALDDAIRRGVNSLWLTSSLFTVLAEARPAAFGNLRLLLVGGERVPVSTARAVLTRFPELHLVNGYGPVETTIFATSHVIRPVDVAEDSTEIPIGTPVPRTEVVLLDSAGRPAAAGETGELAIAGDGVALGYAGDPEETERRFFSAGGKKFYRSGDLAVIDGEGLLRYRGRADHQFKIRGIRIEPGEVEAVLESHPEVASCCVLPVETAPGRVQLAAVYATQHHNPLEPERLRGYLSGTLLDAMVPTLLHHVRQLPLNATGKVDRAAITVLLRERLAVEPTSGKGNPGDVALREVRDLLGQPRLGERDDLIHAGASSLDVIRLAARLGAHLGSRLTAADVYQLRSLEAIRAHRAGSAGPADELPAAGDLPTDAPLSHAQQRFWLAEQSSPGAADNLIVLAYTLTGPLRPEVLEAALNDVVGRHPALRTTYPWHDDAPVQQVLAPDAVRVELERVDPPADDGLEPQALTELVTGDWWSAPFSLEDEVPLRARLCRLSDEQHLLCLRLHHIAFDGWSESVLLAELHNAYAARCGEPSRPAPAGLSYGQYSEWEAGRLSRWAQADLPFWQRELARTVPPFLPPPSPAAEAARRETVLEVDAETVERLTRASARHGGPVVAALLAGAARALAHAFDVADVSVGTVTAGRFDPALESVIGYFVNPLAVTLSSVRDPDPAVLLDQAIARVVSALRHAHTPFDELVRRLAPARERHPFFQAWVVLQNEPPHGGLGGGVTFEPIRVRPPRTAIELMLEAIPAPDGSWKVVILWRADGIEEAQVKEIVNELTAGLVDLAELG